MQNDTWGDLDPEIVLQIVTDYNEGDKQSVEIASHRLGIDVATLSRYCRFYNQYEKLHQKISLLPVTVQDGKKKMVRLPLVPNVPRLTDIEMIDEATDALEWVSWLSDRAVNNPEMTVSHACDAHVPYHVPENIALYIEIIKRAQPDLIVVGSDFADLYLTTSFGIDPEKVINDDELDTFEFYWNWFIGLVRAACPNAKMVFIWGNHERRLIRHLCERSPQLRKRTLRDFINIIKCGGAVWYIGDVDHVRLGPLHVEHGNRHNEHVAKSRLIDEGAQVSMMFGHVHKRNFYELRGADYTVNSISSGALCSEEPNYAQTGTSSRSGRKWTMGTAIAQLNLTERPVYFENALFTRTSQGRETYFRGEKLKV